LDPGVKKRIASQTFFRFQLKPFQGKNVANNIFNLKKYETTYPDLRSYLFEKSLKIVLPTNELPYYFIKQNGKSITHKNQKIQRMV
jgi:hypothetical protein